MKIEDYNMTEGETIELTTAVLGGAKREESRSLPKTEERDAKKKSVRTVHRDLRARGQQRCIKGF